MINAQQFQFTPSLIGTLSTIGGTAVGAPVDRMGFADVLAIIGAGGLVGSGGSTVTLAIKIQESAISTGTNWNDITNMAVVGGSFTLTALTFGGEIAGGQTTGSWLPYQMAQKSCHIADGNRLRYIRCHATLSGTIGLGPKFVAGFVLGNSSTTDYVGAVIIGSGNIEATKLA